LHTIERVSRDHVVRFGLVGCGRISQSHLMAVDAVDDAELRAVVDVRETASRATAEEHHCKHFPDYREPEFLEHIDAAIVCTPPASHHEIVGYLLDHGKHVLCEKPLTIASAQARDLVARAEKGTRLLMMASKFRYVDDIIKAKAIVESGILGNIILYENTFCAKVNMRDRWNAQKEMSGGGVLIDNGSHSVDIVRYLLGPIREVQAQNGINAQGLDVEETVQLQIRTEGGVIGMVDLSWSINKEADAYINLYGSEGTMVIGWQGARYHQDGVTRWIQFGSGYDKLAAFRRQLRNFVDTLKGDDVPLIRPSDALASVEVIEAAYESAGRENWVPVKANGAGRA
jgi:predicted dehydrogenase